MPFVLYVVFSVSRSLPTASSTRAVNAQVLPLHVLLPIRYSSWHVAVTKEAPMRSMTDQSESQQTVNWMQPTSVVTTPGTHPARS